MEKFIACIYQKEDVDYYRQNFSAYEFDFLSFRKISPEVLLVDSKNTSEILNHLFSRHKSHPFRGIVFGSNPEEYVLIAAQVAEKLGLKRMIADPYLARDKYLMKKALRPHITTAESFLVKTVDDIRDNKNIPFPCVLKPRFGYGSIFVVKADNRKKLLSEYRALRNHVKSLDAINFNNFINCDFVVESFIPGTEHTVETFIRDSRAMLQILSDKLPMDTPYFIEVGDVMPSRLPQDAQELVLAAARKAIAGLGIENGWTHTEIKLWNGTPYIMEVAARNGGGYTERMVKDVYGLEMRKMLIDSHLGKPLEKLEKPKKMAFATRIVCYGITCVWKITGLERCRKIDNFRILGGRLARKKAGIFLGPPFRYDNTLLYYSIAHESAAEADRVFDLANKNIKLYKIAIHRIPGFLYRLYLPFLKTSNRNLKLRSFIRRWIP